MKQYDAKQGRLWLCGRAPRGARGLKHIVYTETERQVLSRPARGAWIETAREIGSCEHSIPSRPARGAWIETPFDTSFLLAFHVAPREGRVD